MKKTMKKTMAVVLAVVMLFSTVQLMSFALTIGIGPEQYKTDYAGEQVQFTIEYENEAGELNGPVNVGEFVKIRATVKGLHSYSALALWILYNKDQLRAVDVAAYNDYLDDPEWFEDETGYTSLLEYIQDTPYLDATSYTQIMTTDASKQIFFPTAANSGYTADERKLCTGITWSTASVPSPVYLSTFCAIQDIDGSLAENGYEIPGQLDKYGAFGSAFALNPQAKYLDKKTGEVKTFSHYMTSVDTEITVVEGLYYAVGNGDAGLRYSPNSMISNATGGTVAATNFKPIGQQVNPVSAANRESSLVDVVEFLPTIAEPLIIGGETDKDPADYTDLDAAIEAAAAFDPADYTAATSEVFVAALDAATALSRDLTVDDQVTVDAAKDALYDAIENLVCGHFKTTEVVTDATCQAEGKIEVWCDSVCKKLVSSTPTAKADHDYEIVTVDSTCTVAGSETEVCKNCQAEGTVTELALAAHDYEIVTVDSTCTVAGSATEVCKNCQAIGEVNEFAFAAHEYEIVTVDSTCTVAGSETEVCKNCQATGTVTPLALAAHDYEIVTVDATYTTAGSETEVCKVCGATGNVTVLPMLASYKLTVETENCSVNVPNVTYVAQNAVTPVTVTATPSAGYEFAYWTVNGRIVSYDATYTAQVGFSYTLKAVCTAIDAVSTHTVTFVAFGKVLSTQAVEDGDMADAPDAPSYAGYTFIGWDVSIDSILKNTTVTAVFEKDVAVSFTVEAGNGVSVKGEANEDGTYAYNTKVVATFDESTLADGQIFLGWSTDGTNIICYDATYTFYVGTNVTVTAMVGTSPVKAEATSSLTYTTSGTSVTILAERNAPEGYKLIAAGIIATKDATKALTVESAEANSNVIMSTTTSTAASGQYRLTINVKDGGTLYFTSFAMYTDADGKIVTVYGESVSV